MQAKKLLKGVTVIIVAAVFSLAGLGSAAADKDKNTLYIGGVYDFVNLCAPYDITAHEGVQIAVDEINAAGGVGGKYKIEYDFKDCRNEAGPQVSMTKELLDDGIDVLITTGCTQGVIVMGKLAQKKSVPAITPGNSPPVLWDLVGDNLFIVNQSDSMMGAALAKYAIEQGHKTAYLFINPEDIYTRDLPKYFQAAFEKNGGKIVGEGIWSFGSTDASVEIEKLKKIQPQPDLIMGCQLSQWFSAFITNLRAVGITSDYYGGDVMDDPAAIGLGKVVEKDLVFVSAAVDLPGSLTEKFNKKYKDRYGRENQTAFAMFGYDTVKLIEAAVLKAGSTDSKAIRNELVKLENVKGATTPMSYNGQQYVNRPIAICDIKDGQKKLIKWIQLTTEDIPATIH